MVWYRPGPAAGAGFRWGQWMEWGLGVVAVVQLELTRRLIHEYGRVTVVSPFYYSYDGSDDPEEAAPRGAGRSFRGH